MQDRTVEALNLSLLRMNLVKSDGTIITIMDEPKSLDILKIEANNPVVLSTVSIEPGTYDQLRLVLAEENTIVVDGESFPIKTPSGQQSGVKLDGPFTIPDGKLFSLVLDFVASESVIYNKGQGFLLKPVIRISGTSDVVGTFRGVLGLSTKLGTTETVLELSDQNRFRLKISTYPDYTLSGSYYYSSVSKILSLNSFSLDAPDLNSSERNEVLKKMPSDFALNVVEWSLDQVLAFDVYERLVVLNRCTNFSFSEDISFTNLLVNLDADESRNGYPLYVNVEFPDQKMPGLSKIITMTGSLSTVNFQIRDTILDGLKEEDRKVKVVAYSPMV